MAALIATTDESAALLAPRSGGVPVHVVTNGVEVPAEAHVPSAGADVAFIGWMAYPPNVEAACFLVESVWPRVRSRLPGATLRLIGREPVDAVRALAGPDVVVTGEVPDVVAAAAGVRVGVVSLTGGMGIKNKTLELMAMGLPVVSTEVGAEGVDAGRDDGLLVASEPRELAALVVELLDDGPRADRLGAAARAYTDRAFGWDAIGEQYRRAFADTVRASTGGGAPR
jgi:glycosyltransferase involved in cell wall biosynthesis